MVYVYVYGRLVELLWWRDYFRVSGDWSIEAVGDIHSGSDEAGSKESRAMAFWVEEIVASKSCRAPEETRCLGRITINAAHAAAAASQRQ